MSNVYAPHSSLERFTLWLELISELSWGQKRVLLGDWNFVERCMDKSNINRTMVSDHERWIFTFLTATLGVADRFPNSNVIKHSWEYGSRSMARLDRVCTWITPGWPPTSNTHSDHHPDWQQVELQAHERRQSIYIMSGVYLRTTEVQEKVRRIWAMHPKLSFFGKMRRCMKYYEAHYVHMAVRRWAKEMQLRCDLTTAAAALQADSVNVAN